jgi:hypothetical protein
LKSGSPPLTITGQTYDNYRNPLWVVNWVSGPELSQAEFPEACLQTNPPGSYKNPNWKELV